MSEIGDLHEKINGTNRELSDLNGYLRGAIPNLATKADMISAVAEHAQKCAKLRDSGTIKVDASSKVNTKVVLALASVITALVTVIGFLVGS
jgi:hypothetical protein